MKSKVFTVYDSKAATYMRPFLMNTVGEAVRSWIDVVNDPSTQFHKHSEDFTLFEIAEYDDETAQFKNLPAAIAHGNAIEFKRTSLMSHNVQSIGAVNEAST